MGLAKDTKGARQRNWISRYRVSSRNMRGPMGCIHGTTDSIGTCLRLQNSTAIHIMSNCIVNNEI